MAASEATKSPVARLLRLSAGPAPHWRSSLSRRALNLALVIGLTPAIVAAVTVYGWGALGRLALAGGGAILVELITQRAMRQPVRVTDLDALVQGLLLAMLLPPTVPVWMVLIGLVFMISVAKQLYGGVGGYPFNPVLIGWAALLLSWGHRVHPIAGQLLGTAWTPALAIGGGLLVLAGHLDWQGPVGVILGVIGATLAFALAGAELPPWDEQLLSGSVLLGAFFLATDRTTSPANANGRLAYGLAVGALLIVLRRWGIWAEPVPFAVLLGNALTPVADRLHARPRRRLVRHG